jgi:hypothetical protein
MARRSLTFVEFAERVVGVALTPAQRVLARVAFDGVEPKDLAGDERALARELFGDVDVIPSAARAVLAVVAGARSGKSYLGALRLLHLAITVPLDGLAPGESAVGLIVAPDLRLARQCLRFVSGAARIVPHLARFVQTPTSDGFALRRPDGRVVSLECLPATRGGSAVRGRTLVGAVLDEACFFRDESAVVNDVDLFRAVTPRVVSGGQTIVASTPWAEAGLLYEMHRDQFGKPRTVLVACAPTVLMRPSERERVDAEYERDPENASRELGALFLSIGAGSYFDGDAIRACTDVGRSRALAPALEHRAIAAADFAFSADHSAIVVARVEAGAIVVADWLEVRPKKGHPLRPSEVVGRFAAVARAHGCRQLFADHHYKESVREGLADTGVSFANVEGGIVGKLATYKRAQTAIAERRVVLPDDSKMLGQLRAVQVRPTPGGGLSISHPRSRGAGHGDLCAALVLALSNAARLLARGSSVASGASSSVPSAAAHAFGGAGFGLAPRDGQGSALDRLEVRGSQVVIASEHGSGTSYTFGHHGRGGF